MFSTDHIVSFTLSVVLHLLGLLLIGNQALTRPTEPETTVPELKIASVELALTEEGGDRPGASQAEAQSADDIPHLQISEPFEHPPQPQLSEKPDFTDALPSPEPIPEPVLQDKPAKPIPAPPIPAPTPAPKPAPVSPAATAPTTVSAGPFPSIDNSSRAEGSGGASGHIDAHPSLDHPIRPSYPIGARRRGEEGTVVLDVAVTADGHASSVRLVSSSGFKDLDRAAERAAEQARFKPATRKGQPVESAARLTLIFRLRDQ